MCVEKTNLGWIGSRTRRIPVSSGSRFPFLRLQRRQAATTFVHVVSPPRERGRTWSTVRRSPRRLEYRHVLPARRGVVFFFDATRARDGVPVVGVQGGCPRRRERRRVPPVRAPGTALGRARRGPGPQAAGAGARSPRA